MHHPRPTAGSSRFQVSYERAAALAQIVYEGRIDPVTLEAACESLIETVGREPMIGLVIDVRHSQPAYDPAELTEAVEHCLATLALERCAVLVREERVRLVTLMQSAAVAYAVRVRAFDDAEDARRWVLSV